VPGIQQKQAQAKAIIFGPTWGQFPDEGSGDFSSLAVVVVNEKAVAKLILKLNGFRRTSFRVPQ